MSDNGAVPRAVVDGDTSGVAIKLAEHDDRIREHRGDLQRHDGKIETLQGQVARLEARVGIVLLALGALGLAMLTGFGAMFVMLLGRHP